MVYWKEIADIAGSKEIANQGIVEVWSYSLYDGPIIPAGMRFT